MGITKKPAVFLLLAILAVSGQSSGARESSADSGEVTFSGDTALLMLAENQVHPRVDVEFGDGEQHVFIVDTGASVNVIDSTIARSQGYEVVGHTEIGAPGGPQISADIVKVPLFRVGDVTIVDAEFVTMDVLGFSRSMTHGVLGVGLFSDYLLTFDRGAGYIELSHGSLSEDEAGVLSYNPEGSQVGIDILVAGTQVEAHVDTGSMGHFMLPGEMIESLPVSESQSAGKARLVGGNRDIKMAQLKGDIQFADLQFENPNIAFMTPSAGSGNIGSGVLADYVVSLDQQNHLIGFRRAAGGGAAAANKPRRLGVRFQGMPGGSVLTIASVDPGSLGEQAGLAAGDVLLKLNDKPTEQYDMPELGALFGSSASLKFELERNGEAKTIEFN